MSVTHARCSLCASFFSLAFDFLLHSIFAALYGEADLLVSEAFAMADQLQSTNPFAQAMEELREQTAQTVS